ncbi:MAG TPA: methyltransferase domain-containing protein [Thermoanaerobaculia bacterium]|jgi:ubiquinone/menaquinone biosynthesis C-methylase UbiE|nr:methyltransferase domain-containing protein [Thermoanaerobaculia bacterium]
MTASPSAIQRDFDRIAALPCEAWDHNSHYHPFLLKHIPASADSEALEIGCGTGAFSRLLARRFRRVLALDLSPGMIETAREQSRQYPNIDFQVADAMTFDLPQEQFGCVTSIATLHHLHLEQILAKMKTALKTGGTLVALDLFKQEGAVDTLTAAWALPVSAGLRLIKNGRLREPAEVRAVWAEHGRSDVYLSMPQVRRACASLLPGARVKRHLLWRYSIVWTRVPPAASPQS